MDAALAQIELRLDELEVDHLTIAAFIGRYNKAEPAERRRLRALGDRRLLRELAAMPAAEYSREAARVDEDEEMVASSSVASLRQWVGNDPERAARVRAVEAVQDHPRVTLMAALDAVIAS